MAILLMIIDGYSIGGHWCLLMAIILVANGNYFISGYWWIFCYWILVAVMLMTIGEYSIVDIGGY